MEPRECVPGPDGAAAGQQQPPPPPPQQQQQHRIRRGGSNRAVRADGVRDAKSGQSGAVERARAGRLAGRGRGERDGHCRVGEEAEGE